MTRRLLLGYLGITLFVLVALEVPLGVQHQRTERRDLTAKVEHDATTLASVGEDAVQGGSRRQLSPVARYAYSYARSTGARVVFVDAHGRALVDTDARFVGGESFASRPEFRAALSGRVATGIRYSETLRRRLLYVAVPIASGGTVHGAVRVTYPTSAVDARIVRYWLLLLAVAAVVLAAAAVVGVTLARYVAQPLRALEQAAAAVGAGDLAARAPESGGPEEVRSLARVFNQTVGKVEQLVRVQADFVADASHELRTPLTALRLRLETGDLEGALAEVARLGDRVDGLLALARADVRPASVVDVAATVRERVEHWRPLADEHALHLRADVDGAAPVRAAPERVEQVLDNLLANAVEAVPAGGSVVVSVERAAPWVKLRVRDTGPGMTAEQRTRAFERFFGSGSGLGLAIVRRLVETDGGTVELADAPGGGLEAVVRLRAS